MNTTKLASIKILSLSLIIFIFITLDVYAQQRSVPSSLQFRLGDRIIRVAEQGELADTVNVWGDINSPGRYLIPRNTTLPKLISYAFGPFNLRDRQTNLDWSKLRIEVNISNYNKEQGYEEITNFEFRYNEPLPVEMRTFDLKNNQIISLQVKRKPAFIDYVQVVAPVISILATSILLIENFTDDN